MIIWLYDIMYMYIIHPKYRYILGIHMGEHTCLHIPRYLHAIQSFISHSRMLYLNMSKSFFSDRFVVN